MSRVLVIDDEADFRRVIRAFLEADGHDVVEAENGDDGLEKFRAVQPDIVVTDMLMPKRSGLDTIRQIHAERPEVKIIAMSGGGGGSFATVDLLAVAKDLGADRSLAKPFRRDALSDMVSELLPKPKD